MYFDMSLPIMDRHLLNIAESQKFLTFGKIALQSLCCWPICLSNSAAPDCVANRIVFIAEDVQETFV
jgi:hypothetical protein